MDTGTKFTWFFYGGIILVGLAILFALRPEYLLNKKRLQRKKAQEQRTSPQNNEVQHLPSWPLVPVLLLFPVFSLVVIFVLRLIYLKIKNLLTKSRVDNALWNWLNNNALWLFLIAVVIVGVLLLWRFRSSIPKPSLPLRRIKVPKITWKWKWFWSLLAIAGLTVGGYFVYHKLKDARFGKDIEKYETVKEDTWFKAKKGIPFKKEVLNFEGERWPIIKGPDTVTLTFDPPRGSKWVYKIWNRPDGTVGYQEIKKIPDIIVTGTYLYTVDRDCEFMLSTKKPKL